MAAKNAFYAQSGGVTAVINRLWAAFPLLLMSAAVYAQDVNSIGSGLMQSVCSFLSSPIIVIVFVVAIVGLVVLLVLGEGKGLGSRVVQIVIGAAVLSGMGSIIHILVQNGTMTC